jgi:hypothetical protein
MIAIPKAGVMYTHIASGRMYIVSHISILKQNGKWLESDPIVTYTNQGVHYSRFQSDFIKKFQLHDKIL